MAQVVQGQKVARLKLFGRSPVCVSLGCELLTLRRNFFSFILLFSLSLHFNERRRNKQRHCLWIIQLGLSKEGEGHLLLFLSPPAAAKFKRGFIKSPLRCPGRQSMIVLLYKDSLKKREKRKKRERDFRGAFSLPICLTIVYCERKDYKNKRNFFNFGICSPEVGTLDTNYFSSI